MCGAALMRAGPPGPVRDLLYNGERASDAAESLEAPTFPTCPRGQQPERLLFR
jgi:hypothetical protein